MVIKQEGLESHNIWDHPFTLLWEGLRVEAGRQQASERRHRPLRACLRGWLQLQMTDVINIYFRSSGLKDPTVTA
ncbi:hypothetical protein SKAU_G00013520 [Synaphobranchus kaupii]|uniref:Uncharacterized protein n=1 Tax=Synaphobranchus kaupii TaxID=118154 RepID=A0A9Q1GBQ4_SYNKA|nr:hypothetical protein SKAU_G00013520 [Synaphobranchus kaupii]